MDFIQSIDLSSWESGLHSEGIFYPETPNPDAEIDVIDS
jgi:hypothetical protein